MQELLLIAIGSALVNNVVLSQFLGLCPFLGVSKKTETAAGMGVAVIFVITIASACTSLIYDHILVTLGIEYLQTIVFILIIAVLVQLVNTIACLLAPVQIAPQNEAMLAEICGKVVHVLDGAENAQNAEILGCVLDSMMTMCGVRDGCDVDSERPSSCRSSGSWS